MLHFSLEHAVHIAAHAFSAYLEPVEGRELTEWAAPLPGELPVKTQFLGQDFVQAHFAAIIHVTVLHVIIPEVRGLIWSFLLSAKICRRHAAACWFEHRPHAAPAMQCSHLTLPVKPLASIMHNVYLTRTGIYGCDGM